MSYRMDEYLEWSQTQDVHAFHQYKQSRVLNLVDLFLRGASVPPEQSPLALIRSRRALSKDPQAAGFPRVGVPIEPKPSVEKAPTLAQVSTSMGKPAVPSEQKPKAPRKRKKDSKPKSEEKSTLEEPKTKKTKFTASKNNLKKNNASAISKTSPFAQMQITETTAISLLDSSDASSVQSGIEQSTPSSRFASLASPVTAAATVIGTPKLARTPTFAHSSIPALVSSLPTSAASPILQARISKLTDTSRLLPSPSLQPLSGASPLARPALFERFDLTSNDEQPDLSSPFKNTPLPSGPPKLNNESVQAKLQRMLAKE